MNLSKEISFLKSCPWKEHPYSKQNWGVWMHSVSSYVGRIKPSFAHFLIKGLSSKGDTIFDPFCGIGTIPLESDQLGRKFIANDLNPYAIAITKAKFDRNGLESEISFLDEINFSSIPSPDLSSVPKWVKEYFHKKTLTEILKLKEVLLREEKYFLFGCLLGILHGHRPQHLSIRTGYIIPYIPKPKPKVEYKEVIPRMIQKAKRMYKDELNLRPQGKVICEDSRKLSLKDNEVDLIISSPPYYHTLDYVHANRLRLWLCGESDDDQKYLSKNLIQHRNTYLVQMKEVGFELKRVLKKNGLVVFILGDVHLSSKKTLNSAEDVSSIFEEIGYQRIDIFSDEIPADRTTIVKYGGDQSIKQKKEKLDRVLIMKNI